MISAAAIVFRFPTCSFSDVLPQSAEDLLPFQWQPVVAFGMPPQGVAEGLQPSQLSDMLPQSAEDLLPFQ